MEEEFIVCPKCGSKMVSWDYGNFYWTSQDSLEQENIAQCENCDYKFTFFDTYAVKFIKRFFEENP